MLPSLERLRSNTEFQQVYKQGESFADGMVVLYLLKKPDSTIRQAGFSVSKKLGGAVVRNRVKRRLRESYHHLLPQLPPGFMAVFVARKSAAEADFARLDRSMRKVLARAGLLSDVV